jgi:hypothetical protein
MLVVLNKNRGLIIEVWVSYREKSIISNLCGRVSHISHHGNQSLINDRNGIFSNYYAL